MSDLFTRGVVNIIPNLESLQKRLESGPMKIYFGIDPTATRIHIGHAVGLRKLQAFLEAGHEVTFLIGDFTSLIGDTSDKDSERPVLTSEQINQNFAIYEQQASKILDFSRVIVRHNSEWLSNLNFTDIVKLCQHFSAGDFYSRELIRKRLDEGKRVGLHEVLYAVMQGYDFYHLDADLQIGGTDQTFNMQAGRTLQKDLRNKDAFVMSLGYLTGTDGRKMSKSWSNAIWIEDEPKEMYGKLMSIHDELIIEYFTLATKVELEKIEEIKHGLENGNNPMEFKKLLAHQIVSDLYSKTEAEEAADHFRLTVQEGGLPDEIKEVRISSQNSDGSTSYINMQPIQIVTQSAGISNSEARRLIEQGAVTLNEIKITDPFTPIEIPNSSILKVGKRNYFKLV